MTSLKPFPQWALNYATSALTGTGNKNISPQQNSAGNTEAYLK